MTVFRTTLESTGGNNVGIVVPDDVLAALGGARVRVRVTIDGAYTYSTTIGVRGGRALVSFNAETRSATGKGAGDEIEVGLAADPAPAAIEIPPALAAALTADPAAAAAWERLAPSHRREHVRAIVDAKSDETRDRRVAAAIARLTS